MIRLEYLLYCKIPCMWVINEIVLINIALLQAPSILIYCQKFVVSAIVLILVN